ncbi:MULTISPECIES: hypothetical protein [unclassified Streptomyces]|uniref:hypothetical protein n=1 Tax=unclassified Streptomyces TaxID=2593676 RepID=UPI002B1CAC1C|nr:MULTISPECIES: hypothetical protein [unclassified Streptomyces]
MHSRGEKVEDEAFFSIDELEAIIREWITRIYHQRRHRGLSVPEVPGLKLTPLDMFEHGVTRAGPLRIPARPNLALEFLEEERVPIHHYGVEIEGLRYNGDALNGYLEPHSVQLRPKGQLPPQPGQALVRVLSLPQTALDHVPEDLVIHSGTMAGRSDSQDKSLRSVR